MSTGGLPSERRYDWIVYAAALLFVGGLVGYLLAVQTLRPSAPVSAGVPAPSAAPAPAAPAPSSGATMVDENQLKAFRDILARDPKNISAAVSAGNMLYDAQRFSEAIPLYQQAFALDPSNADVSTDLGTALWYSGRPDEALAQYAKSLKASPTHPQTLFNKGIVERDGKRDFAAAVKTWETLLATNPSYPNAAAVRSMIADLKQKQ